MSSVGMPYTNEFMLSCVLVSMAFITALLLVSLSTNAIYGQVQNQKIGVNITSPERGQTIPINTTPTVSHSQAGSLTSYGFSLSGPLWNY